MYELVRLIVSFCWLSNVSLASMFKLKWIVLLSVWYVSGTDKLQRIPSNDNNRDSSPVSEQGNGMGVFASIERQSKMELDLARPCTAREDMCCGIHDVSITIVMWRREIPSSCQHCYVESFSFLTNKIISFLLESWWTSSLGPAFNASELRSVNDRHTTIDLNDCRSVVTRVLF